MSDAGLGDPAVVPFRARLKKSWWRLALTTATLVLAAFAWYEPIVAVFAAIPVLAWHWGLTRSNRTGMLLLALAVWILLPRGLGVSGPWVPSVFEVCLFLPILTAVIARPRGRLPAVGLATFALAGLLLAGYTAVSYSEGTTGDEGVWPGPSGLRVVEGEREGGSGGYSRKLEATGDRAPERMRDYLTSRGFAPRENDSASICQVNGVVLAYRVCAVVVDISPTTVRVSWWI